LPKAVEYDGDTLSSFTIDRHEVEFFLGQLVNNKSPGPDLIPTKILKHCRKALSLPLTTIFNASLSQGIFPSRWKHANVTPVLKKGSRTMVKNYRPISLLSVMSKIFEKVLHKKIYSHVRRHIAREQHGFISHRSTVTNLAEYVHDIAKHVNNKVQVDAVYTDFVKAFDRVDHVLLLHKLRSFGICGQLHKLLSDYLSDRTQIVTIDTEVSDTEHVTSGVPQGSILGPLLFTLFVNDLPRCIKFSKCIMYADDVKIYQPVRKVSDSEVLQRDIDSLSAWCKMWRLNLNVSKCNIITFTNKKQNNVIVSKYTIDIEALQRVTSIKD
jgi:hypothetical protein